MANQPIIEPSSFSEKPRRLEPELIKKKELSLGTYKYSLNAPFLNLVDKGQTPNPKLAKPSTCKDPTSGEVVEEPSTEVDLGLSQRQTQLINDLAKLGEVGDQNDLELLRQGLSLIHPGILVKLQARKVNIIVARANITNGRNDIAGQKTGGGVAVDEAEGMYFSGRGSNGVIVRTYMRDGKLVLDTKTLLHEIGHALFITAGIHSGKLSSGIPTAPTIQDFIDRFENQSIKPEKNSQPSIKDFEAAFKQEHKNFRHSYFHDFDEFLAESFAWFTLRPDEQRRKFPKTFNLFQDFFGSDPLIFKDSHLKFNERITNRGLYVSDPDANKRLAEIEERNQALSKTQKLRESHAFLLDGLEEINREIALRLSRDLIISRSGRPPYSHDEGLVEITKGTPNLKELFTDIHGSPGAVLYIPDPASIDINGEFVTLFKRFHDKNPGLCHLVIGGEESERRNLLKALPTLASTEIRVSLASQKEFVEMIIRLGADDGYVFSNQAKTKLTELIIRGGKRAEAVQIWQEIKNAQNERILEDSSGLPKEPRSVLWINTKDLKSVEQSKSTDPLENLMSMIGLDNVKERVIQILGALQVNKLRDKLGVQAVKSGRVNMLWPGNPGTGKTTVAKLVAQILHTREVIRNPEVLELGATELLEKGASGAVEEFKKGRGGVIFIDEFHQLDPNNNTKGKPILDLLIPMLTSPEWEDTVFIFAGYPIALKNLMEADVGLNSRLEVVEFEDYTPEELRKIAESLFSKKGYNISEEAFKEFCARVVKKQRSTKFPGNARDVVKTFERVVDQQSSRISRQAVLDESSVEADDLTTITIEDVQEKRSKTPKEVLDEINQKIVGNEEIKSMLRSVRGLVARNKQLGWDILKDIPTTIILEGPAGTGKTSLARYIGSFYQALGILPSDDVVEITGGKMMGGYLGNSSALAVDDHCDKAWGGTLFIDEISSMISGREFSQQSVKQFLSRIETDKGKYLVVIADYPHKIDEFLGFDSGLSRRFKLRVSTEKLSAGDATTLLVKLAAERGWQLEEDLVGKIKADMQKLVVLSQFASGSDIYLLTEVISQLQCNEYDAVSRSGNGDDFDWTKISPAILKAAIEKTIIDVNKRPIPAGSKSTKSDHLYQIGRQVEREHEIEKPKINDGFRDALKAVNAKYSDLANNDPDNFQALLDNPESNYYKDLASELGVTPNEAHTQAVEVQKAVAKQIEEEKSAGKVIKFDYECPFCGQTNSKGCSFYANSEAVGRTEFSWEWLAYNSLKPPYVADA